MNETPMHKASRAVADAAAELSEYVEAIHKGDVNEVIIHVKGLIRLGCAMTLESSFGYETERLELHESSKGWVAEPMSAFGSTGIVIGDNARFADYLNHNVISNPSACFTISGAYPALPNAVRLAISHKGAGDRDYRVRFVA